MDVSQKPTLITGFFFQNSLTFGVRMKADGAGVFVRDMTLRTMFSGVIGPECGLLVGRMTDHYGESELFDVVLGPKALWFTKRYVQRDDLVLYKFKKGADGIWRGTYDGRATGRGEAHCVLMEVPEDFFLPKKKKSRQAKHRDAFED